jgi:hypothetical protein
MRISQKSNQNPECIRVLSQNKYDAAMSQRASAKNALDDFPTPPWATRALAKYVIRAGSGNLHRTIGGVSA